MKAIALTGPRMVKEVDIDVPKIAPHETLVKVKVVGICGSDLHVYESPKIMRQSTRIMRLGALIMQHNPWIMRRGVQAMQSPKMDGRKKLARRFHTIMPNSLKSFASFPWFQVMGHEFSGIVEAVGEKVKNIKVGERIGATPNLLCHKCEACKKGYENLCVHDAGIGYGGTQGALAEFVKVPAENIVKIPSQIPMEEAAILDCVAVALHAARLAKTNRQHTVAILGAGTVGLLLLQVLRKFGVRNIAITDINNYNLDVAKKLGAKYTINASQIDVCMEIKKILGFVDVVFECVGGFAPTLEQALNLVAFHGKTIILGHFFAPQSIEMLRFSKKESTLIGSTKYTKSEFQEALKMLFDGSAQVNPIITHKFPVSKVRDAFETASKKRETKAIKVEIEF